MIVPDVPVPIILSPVLEPGIAIVARYRTQVDTKQLCQAWVRCANVLSHVFLLGCSMVIALGAPDGFDMIADMLLDSTWFVIAFLNALTANWVWVCAKIISLFITILVLAWWWHFSFLENWSILRPTHTLCNFIIFRSWSLKEAWLPHSFSSPLSVIVTVCSLILSVGSIVLLFNLPGLRDLMILTLFIRSLGGVFFRLLLAGLELDLGH